MLTSGFKYELDALANKDFNTSPKNTCHGTQRKGLAGLVRPTIFPRTLPSVVSAQVTSDRARSQ